MKKLSDFGFNTNKKTFIVAEIGINHGGNLNQAKRLIDSAVNCGVDAVKFQTYKTEKRVEKSSPIFKILKDCELSFKDFETLKSYSEKRNVSFFSTPFDNESLDFLESINCDLYKVASIDVTNHKLLKHIAKTKKPTIMSVGMANLQDIKKAVKVIYEYHNNLALLHCISAYPTKEEDANLNAIHSLKEHFHGPIGQSDHTDDINVPLYAVAAGAQIIEKHYKIDNEMECVDSPVSITEAQMKRLVTEVRKIETMFGDGKIELTQPQKECAPYRRETSLV